MRMFDIANTNKVGFWVCAKDRESALNIALKQGHIRDIKNAKVTDVTEEALKDDATKTNTLKAILDGDKEGRLAFQLSAYGFDTLLKIIKGEEQEPQNKGWIIEGQQ